jgi:hypothetical protein
VRPAATHAAAAAAGALLALLLTSTASSRQPSAPRSAVVTPLAPVGTPAADRGADSTPGRTASPLHSPTTSKRTASVEDKTATAKPSPAKPQRTTRPAHGLSGVSTWYAYREGQAAAGPRLRAALGSHWRGMVIEVCGKQSCTRARLTDFMGTHDRAKVIDLDDGLFRRICGPLSMGVCDVTVSWQ